MDGDSLEDIPAKDPGEAFEETFWGLLRRRYRPEQLIRVPAAMGGDCGIEGFSADGIAYQCYADRDSLNLRHRTDKQKQKLYADTMKLQTYAAKLEALLDGLTLSYYFLAVPQYHAAELVTYANTRAQAVRGFGLSFIDSTFAIRIKTPDDYPAELAAALSDGAAIALVPSPSVSQEEVGLFAEEKPRLVQVLDAKLAVLQAVSPAADTQRLRDNFIRNFLAKEQIMQALLEWPDTWEAVERRRQLRESALEMECELSSDPPDSRVLDVVRGYKDDLLANCVAVRDADAQHIAFGQIGDWLMRCPLRFRSP